jgi:hypothetical protein
VEKSRISRYIFRMVVFTGKIVEIFDNGALVVKSLVDTDENGFADIRFSERRVHARGSARRRILHTPSVAVVKVRSGSAQV